MCPVFHASSKSKMSLRSRRSTPAHEEAPLMELPVIGTSKIELEINDAPRLKFCSELKAAWSGDVYATKYFCVMPGGTAPTFDTVVWRVDRTHTMVTTWKEVKRTIIYNWWGDSVKVEREPVQKEVIKTESVWCKMTEEMKAFALSLHPALKKENSKIKITNLGLLCRARPQGDEGRILLDTVVEGASVKLRPFAIQLEREWVITWRLVTNA